MNHFILSCSYGECSVYQTFTEVCANVLKQEVDYVYAKSSLGNQSTIADSLNKILKSVEIVTLGHDEDCLQQVHRVFCHYYLPPCGNITHPAPPSSICQEECQMVQDKCKDTWNAALVVLDIEPVIDCSDTSKLLFPVPHCCTRAGLGEIIIIIML